MSTAKSLMTMPITFLGKLFNDERTRLKPLEKALGVKFNKRSHLRHALTHRSYANEKKMNYEDHNERLEFLGDAVLELVVSDLLMRTFPKATEGELSKLRASMVNEKSLASLARHFGIGEKLYLGKGEELGQGREKSSLLANAYEAVLGALYLDRGFKKTFKVVKTHAENLLKKVRDDGFYKDYKTQLQEKVQNTFKTVPRYRLVSQSGPDHNKTFEINLMIQDQLYGTGLGKSKKEAEQNAAQLALVKLEEAVVVIEENNV